MKNLIGKNEIVSGIRQLDVLERLNVVTDIWDEIKESRELETVSEAEKQILLNRLANYRANPATATDWAELKQEIHNRYGKES